MRDCTQGTVGEVGDEFGLALRQGELDEGEHGLGVFAVALDAGGEHRAGGIPGEVGVQGEGGGGQDGVGGGGIGGFALRFRFALRYRFALHNDEVAGVGEADAVKLVGVGGVHRQQAIDDGDGQAISQSSCPA